METKKGNNMKISLVFIFLACYLNASELNYKQDDAVVGWTMYKEKEKEEEKKKEEKKAEMLEKTDKATLNDLHNVLLVIAQELKETKEEILELKKYINPNAPHYIANEKGERCLANSSMDCFEMPIIQEGRNIPALANFMENPSVDNAKTWLGVQAKLFNRANDMGVALKFASLEGGADTYPVYGRDLLLSGNSNSSAMEAKAIKKSLEKYKDNIGTIVFLGETPALEKAWDPESLARMAYPSGSLYNLLLVFKNQETKTIYDEFFLKHKDPEIKNVYVSARKEVGPNLFKNYKIDVTPTVVAVYKKDGKIMKNTISKGFPSRDELLYGYKQFLIFNKLAEPKDFHANSIWRVVDEK